MRVCTYNIHGGKDSGKRPSLPLITRALKECDADIVMLQEVDRYLLRSGYEDQLTRIAGELDRIPQFYGRLRFAWSAFGNALLARERPFDVRRLPLPSYGGEPRCAIGARIALHDGNIVTAWSTHLGLDNRWRQTQLDALADQIGPGLDPVIVGGDFNCRLGDDEVQSFLAKTRLTPVTGLLPTFPVPDPRSQIDFLFARGLTEIESGTSEAAGSDHCLLWAELAREGNRAST